MEVLYKILPKDLVYIIEDYAKDKTNYNLVIEQFQMQSYECGGHYFLCFPWYTRLFFVSDKLEKLYASPIKYLTTHGGFDKLPPKRHSTYC